MKFKSFFATFTYAVGVLVGLTLIGIAVWGDYEASSYGFARRASEGLRGLSCPILLTRNEPGTISLKVSNPTDRLLHPSVRTEISPEKEPDIFTESVTLTPGESIRLEWAVGPENIDLGNFILASVQVYGTYPIPSRASTCGIFVVDLPGRGQNIIVGVSLFGLVALGGGLYSMNKHGFWTNRPVILWQGILFLAGVIVCGWILSFSGAWLPSIVLLVVAVLVSLLIANNLLSGVGRG
jgi:hypothetical protein